MTLVFKNPENTTDLFKQAESLELYQNLILQLIKDFKLANISLSVTENIAPSEIFEILHEIIFKLIQNDFASYLNLLYIIDIPENKIKKLDGSNTVELAYKVAFLILKREWQKVWFRKFY